MEWVFERTFVTREINCHTHTHTHTHTHRQPRASGGGKERGSTTRDIVCSTTQAKSLCLTGTRIAALRPVEHTLGVCFPASLKSITCV